MCCCAVSNVNASLICDAVLTFCNAMSLQGVVLTISKIDKIRILILVKKLSN